MTRDDSTTRPEPDQRHDVGVGTDGSLDSADRTDDTVEEPPGVGTDGSLRHTPEHEEDER